MDINNACEHMTKHPMTRACSELDRHTMPVQLSTSLAVGLRELSLFVNCLVQLLAQTFNSLLKLLLLEYCFGELVLHNSFLALRYFGAS